ncbi:hypothetical protein GCM10010211_32950 [Streptomyces albospinus]|uniref:Uncharacterized protein n=1 Tax=Streptomyces albospinus TaxID=285515 RepID=A0ABQ2V4Q0_9ACTN|nr:hypothetical protein [Streptomyces albospinus]GGU65241.1 hypothetical protein GCM10010211_32950 [Streptomyces albospinus]
MSNRPSAKKHIRSRSPVEALDCVLRQGADKPRSTAFPEDVSADLHRRVLDLRYDGHPDPPDGTHRTRAGSVGPTHGR